MNIENIQESIKRYVDGTMSKTESIDFERLLESNTDLREEVRLYKALAFVTKNRDLMAMSQIVGSVIEGQKLEPDYETHQEYFKKPTKGGKGNWGLLGGFLSFLLLAGGIFFTVKTSQKAAKYQRIVQNYEHVKPDLINPDTPSVLYDALQFYDKKDYAAAKTAFYAHLRKQPYDFTVQLYAGITQSMTGENTEAIKTLRKVAQKSDPSLKKYADMSLALVLLKMGDTEGAQSLLKPLRDDPVLGENATQILSDLDKE